MVCLEDEPERRGAQPIPFAMIQGRHLGLQQDIGSPVGRIKQAQNVQECRLPGTGTPQHGDAFPAPNN